MGGGCVAKMEVNGFADENPDTSMSGFFSGHFFLTILFVSERKTYFRVSIYDLVPIERRTKSYLDEKAY
jgi:hypothetical protein